MKLTEETINQIRDAASISEVIGHYIPLIRKGKSYTALCPFHDDHDPSLSISEDKKIYKCFVCGNGGNVFSFVMNYKKVSFPEAVKEVADIIGKPIDIDLDPRPKKVSKYQRYHDLLSSMITYSSYLLTASKLGVDALKYLEGRGLEKDIIEKFEIGLDPDDHYLCRYLAKQGFSDEEMIRANVGRLLDDGMHDVFYRRILFPIHNDAGEPVAFSARDYEGFSQAKYINSSETPVYTKGDILYNYHRAKDPVRMAKQVVVCEGVMDVIAFARAGIDNVVATLGTACSVKQLELLRSLNKRLILSYDGDRAGTAANMKLGEKALESGFEVFVLDNRTGLDPDELIGKYGKNTLRDLYSKAVPFIDYALRVYKERYNLDNYTDRKEMTLKVSALIAKLPDEYDRENYRRELYEITKLTLRDTEKAPERKTPAGKRVRTRLSLDGLTKAEYTILMMLADSPKAISLFQKDLGCLLDETDQKLAISIIEDTRKHGSCDLSRIYDESADPQMKDLIATLGTLEEVNGSYDEVLFKGAIERIKREIKQRKLKALGKKLSDAPTLEEGGAERDLEEYLKLVKELGGSHGKNKN